MKSLSKEDLESFKMAVLKDYGLKLEEEELFQEAFKLLEFFEALIKFNQGDKNKTGSKTVQDNPLNTGDHENKIK